MAKKLFVGNISYQATDDTLKGHFTSIGEVESVAIIVDRMSGRSKGFGFVEMVNDDDAQKAIDELDGKEFDGRPLAVSEARPPK